MALQGGTRRQTFSRAPLNARPAAAARRGCKGRAAPVHDDRAESRHGLARGADAAPPAGAAPGAPLAGRAAPEHGRAPGGARLLPLVIKDVAGLVPGARDGRGRGNQFLNDLVDADVLIHVVDASGRSDREGVEGGEGSGDPLDDVMWVRDEIHGWIFTNVRRKWATPSGVGEARGDVAGYGADRAPCARASPTRA